ncbi:MAG: hypothetical protein IAF58_02215 [Leptolyngbya sp.]|nr:hypothetical protein [Candidatus Melainabacteria bacterium]
MNSSVLSKSRGNQTIGFIAAAASFSFVLCFQLASFAQPTAPAYRKEPYAIKPAENHSSTQLKDKVDLPDLPSYTGKAKFTNGYVESDAKGGPRYSMSFSAQEPEGQILDWYENVFRMYKWKNIKRDEIHVAATHKDGHYASVKTDHMFTKDNRPLTSIQVHYQMSVK